MPLSHGRTDAARSANIGTEIRAGKDPKQAAAIAYAVQRRGGGKDKVVADSPDSMSWLGDLRNFARGLMAWASEEDAEGEHTEPTPAVAIDPEAEVEDETLPPGSEQGDQPQGRAAGVAFITPEGKVLFLKRSGTGDHEGEWCLPGGMAEDDEEPWETARREAAEEIGGGPEEYLWLQHLANAEDDDVLMDGATPLDESDAEEGLSYSTYAQPVTDEFEPTLNDEHSEHVWAGLDDLPTPLHPGVAGTIQRLTGAASEAPEGEAKEAPVSGDASVSTPAGTRMTVGKQTTPSNNWETVGKGPARQVNRMSNAVKSSNERLMSLTGDAETSREAGKLSATTEKAIGSVGSEHREEMPADAFLLGAQRKYPVKEKSDGEWKYTRDLLLAAARRARLQGRGDLARKADDIRAREFGSKGEAEDAVVHDPKNGQFASGGGNSSPKVPTRQLMPSENMESHTEHFNKTVPPRDLHHAFEGRSAALRGHKVSDNPHDQKKYAGAHEAWSLGHSRGMRESTKNFKIFDVPKTGAQDTRSSIWDRLSRLKQRRTGAMDALALDWCQDEELRTERLLEPLALDKDSVREKDKDGRLHVSEANISKANVCPYYGKEIPNFAALGLDPEKKYMLYRDPDELKKGAKTFAGLPILSKHVPIDAKTHDHSLVVGATGDRPKFDGTYLKNSLAFWPQEAIDGIESDHKKQLSAAYHYLPVMQPGTTPDGIHFDGRMTNIIGNHLAQVQEGRAGSDVVVGDAAIPPNYRYNFSTFRPGGR